MPRLSRLPPPRRGRRPSWHRRRTRPRRQRPARARRIGTRGTYGPPTGRACSTVPWGRTRSTRAGGSTRLKARTRSHAPPAPRQPPPAVHGQGVRVLGRFRQQQVLPVPRARRGGAGRLNLCSALTQRKCSRLACASPWQPLPLPLPHSITVGLGTSRPSRNSLPAPRLTMWWRLSGHGAPHTAHLGVSMLGPSMRGRRISGSVSTFAIR